MTDRLKAWCHWKRKENHVSEDDLLMVRDIESLIVVAEAAKDFLTPYPEPGSERHQKLFEALKKLETVE